MSGILGYDYTYDGLNRLTNANYRYFNGSTWTTDGIFSESFSYDITEIFIVKQI